MLSLNLPERVRLVNGCMLMSETIEGLWNKFLIWKEVFESKGLKVYLGKPR